VYTHGGTRESDVPIGIGGRAPTDRDMRSAVERLLATLPPAGSAERRRQLLAIRRPATLAPYTRLLADPAGLIWAVTSLDGAPVTELQAVAADGRRVANVRLPRPLTVLEVGRDYVLARHEDESGEQRVLLYRIRRSA
jgi:hypothetical protein